MINKNYQVTVRRSLAEKSAVIFYRRSVELTYMDICNRYLIWMSNPLTVSNTNVHNG